MNNQFVTSHKIYFNDSRQMGDLRDESIHLVITSPPYPKIEMWDDLFLKFECQTYDQMHDFLEETWRECYRVLIKGGICCINIGDSVRKCNGDFRLFSNHSTIIEKCINIGFVNLPSIIWKKPTNKPNKFMGSGMIPNNAYATLEHEYVLILRKSGKKREFPRYDEKRYNSAYFFEERNVWFSDQWTDLKGESQKLKHQDLRDRSAAYPFDLAYRIINMYSIQGDTVLDPFWGTGTTTLAAMASARNSIGYEIEKDFFSVFNERKRVIPMITMDKNRQRLENHEKFIISQEEKKHPKYFATNYPFGVMNKQEKDILFYDIDSVIKENNDKISNENQNFYHEKILHKKHNYTSSRQKKQKQLSSF